MPINLDRSGSAPSVEAEQRNELKVVDLVLLDSEHECPPIERIAVNDIHVEAFGKTGVVMNGTPDRSRHSGSGNELIRASFSLLAVSAVFD